MLGTWDHQRVLVKEKMTTLPTSRLYTTDFYSGSMDHVSMTCCYSILALMPAMS